MAKICAECDHFQPAEPSMGTCMRFPPNAFPTGQGRVSAVWPPVRPDQSCGEWKQKLYVAKDLPPMPKGAVQ